MFALRRNPMLVSGAAILVGSMIWAAAPASAADVIIPPGMSQMPAGATDCTPSRYAPGALPPECTGNFPKDEFEFNVSNVPGMEITPGAARTATRFNIGPIIAALGPFASMPLFYVDFGDGTGFGNSGDLKSMGSLPTSHVYVNPGTYTVTGYGFLNDRTESTSATITIAPAKEQPAAAKVTESWENTTPPPATAVVAVEAADRSGAFGVGTAESTIVERSSGTAARSESKAPQVNTTTGQTTLVNIPSLTAGSSVKARVKIGKTWTSLPETDVESDGTLKLPALTFAKAGNYPVRLRLENGGTRYVKVKVKKG
jgi:hypothetical protein